MRIGLVDVDGHNFPNLALMKLSAWHKCRGDTVEFADPAARRYDKVYMSKVFTFSRDCTDRYDCEVVRAGTGYRDYATILPEEIEHICPDYSLYGVKEAYGFLTRGCVNHCPWCVVPHKEGVLFRGQQLVKPLLDHGLPITSGYTHHRNVEGLAMTFGQALQSFQRTDHLQEIGIGTGCHVFRQTTDHKRAYPPTIKFGNITVPVVTTAFQRKKQSIFRETQRTAIR